MVSIEAESDTLANAVTQRASCEVDCGGLSHIGPARADNQDAIRLPDGAWAIERGLLYGLADGMGGYAHGGAASRLALEALFKTFHDGSDPRPVAKNLRRGVEAANLGVYQAAQRLGGIRMGTTLTAAAFTGRTLHVAHVGDSRAYLVRDGRAVCLTRDHTAVGELVRMRVLSPDKVRTHAQRSILNRAAGLGLFVQPDMAELKLQEDDRVILCSDGLWSVVEDEELAQLARSAHGAQALSHDLVNLALARETDDNVSAVAIHFRRLAPGVPGRAAGRDGRRWFAALRERLHGNGQ